VGGSETGDDDRQTTSRLEDGWAQPAGETAAVISSTCLPPTNAHLHPISSFTMSIEIINNDGKLSLKHASVRCSFRERERRPTTALTGPARLLLPESTSRAARPSSSVSAPA
jgi:hypothetical protein